MGEATLLFHWSPDQFWQSTPQEFTAARRTYQALFCAESETQKRRAFAIFRRDVEAGEDERRWQRDRERRKRKAQRAKSGPPKPPVRRPPARPGPRA